MMLDNPENIVSAREEDSYADLEQAGTPLNNDLSPSSVDEELSQSRETIKKLEKALKRYKGFKVVIFFLLKLIFIFCAAALICYNARHAFASKEAASVNGYLAQNTTLILAISAWLFNPSISEWAEHIVETLGKLANQMRSK